MQQQQDVRTVNRRLGLIQSSSRPA
jgi:hypothetical protein